MSSVKENAVIILAGGLGTRLREATGSTPKILAPIGNRPFLDLLLLELQKNGYRRVILSLGHGADAVQGYLRSSNWSESFVSYVKEEKPLGTGGALAHAISEAGLSGPITVANGDTWIEGAWAQLPNMSPLSPSVGVVRVADTSRFGLVQLDEPQKHVLSFKEKSPGGRAGMIYSGIAVLSAADLGHPPTPEFSLEKDVLPKLAASGQLGAFHFDGRFTDIGVPEDYYAFCSERRS